MEESEWQVDFLRKYVERIHRNKLEKPALENWRKRIQSFARSGKVHDSLTACIHAYSSDVFDLYYIEILIESVVQKAKDYMKYNAKLTFNHFICTYCCDVIRDPVTLKCGHTFSKKCILANKIDFCDNCGMSCGYNFVPQLKNNVIISTLIETFWNQSSQKKKIQQAAKLTSSEKAANSKRESKRDLRKRKIEKDNRLPILQSSIFEDYSRKGDLLVTLGKLEDALVAYFISLSFGVSRRNVFLQTKEKAVKILDRLLTKYECKFCKYAFKKFNLRSVQTVDMKKRNSLNESSVSCHFAKDENECVPEEWYSTQWIGCSNDANNESLHNILRVFFKDIEKITSENNKIGKINASYFEKCEFDCPLCIRTLWEPVTTPCGHTFCRVCLNRSLDHQVFCPLCKTSLSSFLAQRIHSSTEFIELAIRTLFPEEYLERKAIYVEEMEELKNAGKDPEHAIPLFICTNAYPTVPCPLHVFEPRYRLMIRRCMESGSKQFGMCAYIDDNIAEYGTLLQIRDVQYFPDGRSVVDAVGSKRFRILKKGERDGYHTASVEFLRDEAVATNMENVTENHDRLYEVCKSWFLDLPEETRCQIVRHFGAMPSIEANFLNNPNGPSWYWWILAVLPLEPRLQLSILSMTSLPRRLDTLNRILMHLQSSTIA